MDLVHRRALGPDRRNVLSQVLASDTLEFLTRFANRELANEPLWLEALTHGSTGADRKSVV